MADINLSLDEIIKVRKLLPSGKPSGGRKRSKGKKKAGEGVAGGGLQTKAGEASNGKRKSLNKNKFGDARLKIIEKKRHKMRDARDKLAELAKMTDARHKLQRLRMGRAALMGFGAESEDASSNTNIVVQTGPNGRLALSTKKGRLLRAVGGRMILGGGGADLPPLPLHMPPPPFAMDFDGDEAGGAAPGLPPLILRTVSNKDALPPPPPPLPHPGAHPANPYKWVRGGAGLAPHDGAPLPPLTRTVLSGPHARPSTQASMSSHKRKRGGGPRDHNWDDGELGLPKRVKPITIRNSRSESPESPPHQTGARAMVQVRPRTNTTNSSQGSAASKSRSDHNALVPGGFKVVVSNLQSSVSQEDITELFADIGELRRAQLVKPGLAEVSFVERADAVRAVDVYHNRQLDGRPMKCTLVTTATYASSPPPLRTSNRASSSPSSSSSTSSLGGRVAAPSVMPVQTTTSAGQSCLRSSSGSSMDFPTGGKCSVTPDVATIHKALFNKSHHQQRGGGGGAGGGAYASGGGASQPLRPSFTVTLPKSKQPSTLPPQ